MHLSGSALPIALTCGDPAGVGPEIIQAWLRANPERWAQVCPIGPEEWVRQLPVEGRVIPASYPVWTPGRPDPEGARCAWAAMELAASGCREGIFAGVVTGPVSKQALSAVGFPYPGQTEFFAARWGGRPAMAFAAPGLRVVLATWHQPLVSVPATLLAQPETLEFAIRQAQAWCLREGITQPRIAVCGLNPHAGESGLLGREECDVFDPQLRALRSEVPGLSECLPADTVFFRHRNGEFDAVVALYHDQALVAVKTVAFHEAVNVTLGLPYLRSSPDHGTAFTLAGTGRADPRSFSGAVALHLKLNCRSSTVAEAADPTAAGLE